MLFLIKPPAAKGQSHSWVKFACPDMRARQTKFPPGQALLAVREFGAGAVATSSLPRAGAVATSSLPFSGGLSWTQIRLHCAASIATALDGRRALRFMRPPDQQRVTVFTFAAEFIN
jgi:hypothetical protein